jgi:uncharacterized membrane protein YphA (DoxX/SURF4 family)
MVARHPLLSRLALLALCSAYIQGPLTKLADWPGAQAEMLHFGLRPPGPVAAGVIVFELAASLMVVTGVRRRPAALALAVFTMAATLIALRFWTMPAGPDRAMATNAFFEHLGLAGAFVFVALQGPAFPRQE